MCVWGEADCWEDGYMPAAGQIVEFENFLRLICMHLCDVCRVDMILCKSIIFFELDMLTHTY